MKRKLFVILLLLIRTILSQSPSNDIICISTQSINENCKIFSSIDEGYNYIIQNNIKNATIKLAENISLEYMNITTGMNIKISTLNKDITITKIGNDVLFNINTGSTLTIMGSLIESEEKKNKITIIGKKGSVYGSIFYVSKNGKLILDSVTVKNNNIYDYNNRYNESSGGVINDLGGHVEINSNVIFDNNTAKYGGAISSVRGEILINKYNKIINNVADDAGGGIYINYGKLIINNNNIISNNTAIGFGGAIVLPNNLFFAMNNSNIFENNSASLGAALDFETKEVYIGTCNKYDLFEEISCGSASLIYNTTDRNVFKGNKGNATILFNNLNFKILNIELSNLLFEDNNNPNSVNSIEIDRCNSSKITFRDNINTNNMPIIYRSGEVYFEGKNMKIFGTNMKGRTEILINEQECYESLKLLSIKDMFNGDGTINENNKFINSLDKKNYVENKCDERGPNDINHLEIEIDKNISLKDIKEFIFRNIVDVEIVGIEPSKCNENNGLIICETNLYLENLDYFLYYKLLNNERVETRIEKYSFK